MRNIMNRTLLFLISASLIVSLLAVAGGAVTDEDDDSVGSMTLSVLMATHSVIVINSDAEFASQASSESWSGNGTAAAPYEIKNYGINATGESAGIYIGNTTVHFVIRNCLVHHADTAFTYPGYPIEGRAIGILLNNVTNAVVQNTTVHDNQFGILLFKSDHNVIKDNICYDNVNDCITMNTADNNTISGNTLSDGSYCLTLDYLSDWNVLSNNTVSDSTTFGIYAVQSTNNTIENNDLDNDYYGIYLNWESENNTVSGNDVNNSAHNGITTRMADRNIITDNIVRNSYYSLCLDPGSDEDQFLYNVVEDGYYGVYAYQATNSTIGGNLLDDHTSGVYLSSSENITIEDNYIGLCDYGVYISDSNDNDIDGNSIDSNNYGVYLDDGADDNTVSGNDIRNSINNDGIRLKDADRNLITRNSIHDNEDGIHFSTDADNNTVTNNSIENNYDGLYMYSTNNNLVQYNSVRNNADGIYLDDADSNNISDNFFQYNYCGVYVYNSDDVMVFDNALIENVYGVDLDGSNDNTILENFVSGSGSYAVRLISDCSGNAILGNTFVDNNGATDAYDEDSVQAYDAGTNEWNDSTHGNYWSDWLSPDADHDGIVDVAYVVEGGVSTDALPMTTSDIYTAPQIGDVDGIVTDAENNTMANVTVSMGGMSTITDSFGHFAFSNVTADAYTVTFAKAGYSVMLKNVIVTDNHTSDMGTVVLTEELTEEDVEAQAGNDASIAYYALIIVVIVAIAAIVIMFFRMKK